MTLVTQAVIFAAQAHDGAARKGSEIPYIVHPMEVVAIASTMTDDPQVLAAAALHDVMEDCGVTFDALSERFGVRVAGLVCEESQRACGDPCLTWNARKLSAVKRICGGCRATGRCVRGGLVNDAIDAMETADALVLASPVHYAGISGAMSAFCDRLFYAGGSWANKPCACVVSARRAGTTAALDQLVKYPMISNMPVVSSQYWPMVHGARPEDVAQDEEGLQTMRQLARNLLWLLQCIAAGDAAGVPRPETEARKFTNFIR